MQAMLINDADLSESALLVLVVDDIASSRQALCDQIREIGHQAIEADGGLPALLAVSTQRPDVIFVDLLMPGVDGFEVCSQIRALSHERWIPVIVTSALEGNEPFVHALERGADDYLSRPVQTALLKAKLRHYQRVLAMQTKMIDLASWQRAISDNILDAVITLNEDGTIEDANAAANRLFQRRPSTPLRGLSVEAAVGVPLEEIRTASQLKLKRGDNSQFHAEVSISAWQSGDANFVTLVVHDLTERLRIDRMKDEFLATVSHELRTPLTSIQGALGLITSEKLGKLPDDLSMLANMAHRNGERLGKLIDDILDLTKLEGNRMTLHAAPSDLSKLVKESMAANEGYALRAGIQLTAVLPPDPVIAKVDPDRFLQVMANLLSNAIKHSPQRGVVTVELCIQSHQACLAVMDQGPGIDAKFRPHLFSKFAQANSSDQRTVGGTGLGLYVTRLLVEKMNGTITASSSPGQGARFEVQLPLQDALGVSEASGLIVHVDHDKDCRDRIATLLRDIGPVESAPTIEAARQQLQGRAIALLIADPQAQGPADAFCATARALCHGAQAWLYSDSADAAFAERMHMRWVPKSGTDDRSLQSDICQYMTHRKIGRSN